MKTKTKTKTKPHELVYTYTDAGCKVTCKACDWTRDLPRHESESVAVESFQQQCFHHIGLKTNFDEKVIELLTARGSATTSEITSMMKASGFFRFAGIAATQVAHPFLVNMHTAGLLKTRTDREGTRWFLKGGKQ